MPSNAPIDATSLFALSRQTPLELVVNNDGLLPEVPAPLQAPSDHLVDTYYIRLYQAETLLAKVAKAISDHHKKTKKALDVRDADHRSDLKLSWRVHILPELGYQALYDRFDLSQPWDSEANLPLLDEMPKEYQIPGDIVSTNTRISFFTNQRANFVGDGSEPRRGWLDDLRTILLGGVVGHDKAVPWTQPVDTSVELDNIADSLGDVGPDLTLFFYSGTLLRVPASIPNTFLSAALTVDGDEYFDVAATARWAAQYYQLPYMSEPLGVNKAAFTMSHAMFTLRSNWRSDKTYPQSSNVSPQPRRSAGGTGGDIEPSKRLGWRVHLLSDMDYRSLQRKFRFNEPWDSPHNLKMAKFMPDVYRDPSDSFDSVKTRIAIIQSPYGIGDGETAKINAFKMSDDPASTIMLIHAPVDKAILWTRPDFLEIDPADPLAAITPIPKTGLLTLFGDGRARLLKTDITAKAFLEFASIAGGESINADDWAQQ